ncbi:MAG: murein biosynthesis integral membrane protein MurJ [Candidatus Sungbacteria bacterium]|uniref:Probable lipid II flippase MurJ n=1 Tax=Candidatus Sungiibacteriota bacterium TaxID=2750080 RepID=A0A932YV57_9BACT|nr:murein biosynthesis integral membrane protein MurJ [Candidatus Sungbacteria bacterium]
MMWLKRLNSEIASPHAAALLLGGAAFLSKLLGMFRDRLLAGRFGAGDTLDSYYAAFQIPDILFTVFLVGAASAAVLPVFVAYEREGAESSEKFVSNLLTVFSVFASLAIVAAIIGAPWLVRLVAPGFGAEKLRLAIELTRLLLVNTLFLGIAGILSSVLQARHRFFVFALPPIVYNLGIVGGILFFVPFFGPIGLAYGVLAGGVMQILIAVPALVDMRFGIRPRFQLDEPGLRQVTRTALPRVLAIVMNQVVLVVLAAIASFFAAGSVSVFRLAANLLYVPVGLFGVSYALAIFPKISQAAVRGEYKRFAHQLQMGVRNILFWVLPAAVLFVVLRAHIVRVVLGAGAFDWEDTRLVAAVLAVLALAVVSESILPLILRAFYALGRTREPLFWDFLGSLTAVGLSLGFAFLFFWQPPALAMLARILRIGDLASPDILAVALGFALGSIANVFLLSFALRRVLRLTGGARPAIGRVGSMVAAALIAGVAAYLTLLPFPALVSTRTFVGIALQGLTAGAAGLAVYGLILAWQKNPEILAIAESFRQHLVSLGRTPEVFETEKLDGDSAR